MTSNLTSLRKRVGRKHVDCQLEEEKERRKRRKNGDLKRRKEENKMSQRGRLEIQRWELCVCVVARPTAFCLPEK